MPDVTRARTGFGADERRAIIDRYRRAWEAKETADRADDADAERAARDEMAVAAKNYVEGVPIVGLSRDPFTGDVFETSIDTFDLDGLWWAYEREHRPWVSATPAEPGPELMGMHDRVLTDMRMRLGGTSAILAGQGATGTASRRARGCALGEVPDMEAIRPAGAVIRVARSGD